MHDCDHKQFLCNNDNNTEEVIISQTHRVIDIVVVVDKHLCPLKYFANIVSLPCVCFRG